MWPEETYPTRTKAKQSLSQAKPAPIQITTVLNSRWMWFQAGVCAVCVSGAGIRVLCADRRWLGHLGRIHKSIIIIIVGFSMDRSVRRIWGTGD